MSDQKTESSGRILIAEDAIANQMLAKAILQRMGFEVAIAADGEQAVKRAAEEDYDLILMDIQMPLMDGLEATRRLRELGTSIPIVALTASISPADRQTCIDAGCTDYMDKPIDPQRLEQMLRVLLGRNTAAPACDP